MSSGWLSLFFLVLVAPLGALASIFAIQENQTPPPTFAQSGPKPESPKVAALEAQRKAEADPSEENLFLYAQSLMKVNFPAAETIYRFAVNKYPDSVRLHAGLASALWALGKPDEGAVELCRAAELAPQDPHPLEFLAATEHIPTALYQKVVEGLRQLHLRYPQDGLILFDYEMVLSNRYEDKSQVPRDFVPTLKEAIRLNPRLPEAYFQLSLVYDQQKNYTEEAHMLRRAVQLSPEDEHYRYNLAMAYKRMGNKEAFLKELSVFQKMHSRSLGTNQ
jgi:tetratricopeptide (TPR) repeat protein